MAEHVGLSRESKDIVQAELEYQEPMEVLLTTKIMRTESFLSAIALQMLIWLHSCCHFF